MPPPKSMLPYSVAAHACLHIPALTHCVGVSAMAARMCVGCGARLGKRCRNAGSRVGCGQPPPSKSMTAGEADRELAALD